MKKVYSLLLPLLCLATACVNDIEVLPDDEPRKLIVNAILNASRTDNAVYLALSGYQHPETVKNGIIRLYINGEPAETVTECSYTPADSMAYYATEYMEYPYRISSRFHTGDRVRIEVETKDGAYRASAETSVYEPIQITRIDTIAYGNEWRDVWGGSLLYQSYYAKLKVGLETTSQEQTQYYRVNMKEEYTYRLVHLATQEDSVFTAVSQGCDGRYDTALTDGKPGTSNDDIVFLPTQSNDYQVFSNVYFSNGRYTMSLEKSDLLCHIDTLRFRIAAVKGKSFLQYYAISPLEYQYLRAASYYEYYDSENPLEVPVTFPSNVEGGTGIFAIENPTEYIVENNFP